MDKKEMLIGVVELKDGSKHRVPFDKLQKFLQKHKENIVWGFVKK